MSYHERDIKVKIRPKPTQQQQQSQQQLDNLENNESIPDTNLDLELSINNSSINLNLNKKHDVKRYQIKQASSIHFGNDLINLYKEKLTQPNVVFNIRNNKSVAMHSFVLLARSAWFRRCWRARECENNYQEIETEVYDFNSRKTRNLDIEIKHVYVPDSIDGTFEFDIEDPIEDKQDLVYQSFIEFKKFLYVGRCNLDEDNAKKLISFAFSFKIDSLEQFLTRYLIKTITVKNIDGLLDRLELAHVYNLVELKKECVQIVNFNSEQVIHTNEWSEFANYYPEIVIEMFRDI